MVKHSQCFDSLWHSSLPLRSGTCVLVFLFPELGVIPGKEPLPIPITEFIMAWHDKWVVQVISFLTVLVITAGIISGAVGLNTPPIIYPQFSSKFMQDLQQVAQTVLTLQDQIDPLAAVVLQNQQELDSQTAERGDLCLFLREEYCFYGSQSCIVKDKIRQLQMTLQKHKKQLDVSGQWIIGKWSKDSWILFFLTPLLLFFLILLVSPCLINFLFTFLQQQIQRISFNQTLNHLLLPAPCSWDRGL